MPDGAAMNHTVTHISRLFVCADCTWRAVLTTDGRLMQTQAGDAGHDHIGQAQLLRDAEQSARRAVVEQTMDRLRQHYADRDPLPSGHDLNLGLLQRLYKYVMTEHEP